jgi:cytochrome b pre-mRNA-processing protein 3
MIFQWFRPAPEAQIIARLYGAIVAQARNAVFYRDYQVPDSVNGRLELVLLHTVLTVRRFSQESAQRARGQAQFDHFCSETDAALREMGVGDLTVPKQMRKLGEAFYSRRSSLDEGLAGADPAPLAGMLERVLGEGEATRPDVARLAAYLRTAAQHLEGQPAEALASGDIQFPDPSAIATVATV